jgi:hypothetical protein
MDNSTSPGNAFYLQDVGWTPWWQFGLCFGLAVLLLSGIIGTLTWILVSARKELNRLEERPPPPPIRPQADIEDIPVSVS